MTCFYYVSVNNYDKCSHTSPVLLLSVVTSYFNRHYNTQVDNTTVVEPLLKRDNPVGSLYGLFKICIDFFSSDPKLGSAVVTTKVRRPMRCRCYGLCPPPRVIYLARTKTCPMARGPTPRRLRKRSHLLSTSSWNATVSNTVAATLGPM